MLELPELQDSQAIPDSLVQVYLAGLVIADLVYLAGLVSLERVFLASLVGPVSLAFQASLVNLVIVDLEYQASLAIQARVYLAGLASLVLVFLVSLATLDIQVPPASLALD